MHTSALDIAEAWENSHTVQHRLTPNIYILGVVESIFMYIYISVIYIYIPQTTLLYTMLLVMAGLSFFQGKRTFHVRS